MKHRSRDFVNIFQSCPHNPPMILVFKTITLTTRKEKAIALILAPQIKSSNDNGIISVTSYF